MTRDEKNFYRLIKQEFEEQPYKRKKTTIENKKEDMKVAIQRMATIKPSE